MFKSINKKKSLKNHWGIWINRMGCAVVWKIIEDGWCDAAWHKYFPYNTTTWSVSPYDLFFKKGIENLNLRHGVNKTRLVQNLETKCVNKMRRWVCVYVNVPGANGNFIWIMDVGAGWATVTLAKAVEVHAVLFGLLFLLPSLANDGQTLLHRPTERANTNGFNTGSQPLLTSLSQAGTTERRWCTQDWPKTIPTITQCFF